MPPSRALDAARALFMLAALGAVSSPPVANIAAALGLVALALSAGIAARLRLALAQPMVRGVLALLGVLAVATLWADGVPWARRFAEWWSWRALILLVAAFLAFDERRWRRRFCATLVVALALAALASFGMLLTPNPTIIDEPGVILRNHTTQGMAMVGGFVLAGALLLEPGAPRGRRALLLAAMALFVANIAHIADGRSGYLALLVAAGTGAFAYAGGRRRWLALVAVVLLGAVALASSGTVRHRLSVAVQEFQTAKTSPVETSMGLRVVIWETTARLLERHPVLGYGVGGFAPAYAQEIHQHYTGWQAAEAKDTHNQYLRVWVEAGIPGLLALLVFIAGVLRQRGGQPFAAAGHALFVAWLATSLFNSHLQTFAESHLLAVLVGALLAGPLHAAASASPTAAATAA